MSTSQPCANACGDPRDRPGQRYCRACHAEYMRGWRKQQRAKLTALMQARYDAIGAQLSSTMFHGEPPRTNP